MGANQCRWDKSFFYINILMGLHVLPDLDSYWSLDDRLHVDGITKVMPKHCLRNWTNTFTLLTIPRCLLTVNQGMTLATKSRRFCYLRHSTSGTDPTVSWQLMRPWSCSREGIIWNNTFPPNQQMGIQSLDTGWLNKWVCKIYSDIINCYKCF